MRASSSAVRGPVVNQPERSVSATASISSSPIAGGWKERKVVRLDESFGIGRLEAYEIGCAGRAFQSLLAAGPDGKHGARPVGSSAQRTKSKPRRPIHPHVDHAFDCCCL